MTKSPRLALACTALLAFPAAGQREGAKGDSVEWEGDYDAALAKAAKEKKPILVSFTLDGEPANERQWTDTFVDPKFVALSRKMVCLAGNIAEHAPAGQPCPRFPGLTCEQHQAVERKIRARYLKTDLVVSPQHVFCAPGGEELFRKVWERPKGDLLRAMAMAIAARSAAPPGAGSDDVAQLATDEHARVDRLLKDIESTNLEVRDVAFAGLATTEDPRALKAILAKAKADNSPMVRYAAIHALGQKGNYAGIQPLLGFLKERDTKISIYALNSLMKIELPDPVPDLLKLLLQERNDRVRAYALRAVAKCHPKHPEVQKACLQALKGASASLEAPAMLAAFTLEPDPKIGAALKPKLSSGTSDVRALAAWVLGKQRDPSFAPLLEKMAAEDKSLEVREIAPKALAYCKGEEVAGYEDLGKRFYYEEDLAEVGSGRFSGGREPKDSGSPPRARKPD
ncbi:MAG TPA: HEAT repeat domain-containing protein [Planctomycetota bacterium]|nr:HEAT repeat domain-containing protein [Planctomycetota bacterium]